MALHPWFLETDKETGIPVITFVGDMTIDMFAEFLSVTSNTPSYRNSDGCLWDLRGVSDFLPTMAIRYLAASIKQATKPPRRTAIVVGRDVHFGLARMFAIRCEQPGITRRVFQDYEQARAWLLKRATSTKQVPVRHPSVWQRPVH
jgi:hypothetical protein